jgi:hypothetical protein
VDEVAHLLAGPAVAEVGQRAPGVVREEPVREDALVDLPHLPRSRDHPAAVDRRAHAEAVRVLRQQELGGELRRPVQRARPLEREVLGDTVLGGAGEGLLGLEREARVLLAQPQGRQRRDWIDAAGREEDHLRAVAAGELEAVVGPEQVRLHDVVGAGAHPGQHGRLGRALHHRVDGLEPGQVVALAHVTVHERDPRLAQPRKVELGAAALERVERDHLGRGPGFGQREAEARADEARAARDEHACGEGAGIGHGGGR